jgi:hypothetical protein
MDAATVPWVVLGVVLFALAGLLAAPAARRGPRPAPVAPAGPPSAPRPAFPDDDLPAFRAAPPGTPGAVPPDLRPAPVRVAPGIAAAPAPPAGRVVLAMAAAALALVAVLAVLAGVDRTTGSDPGGTSDGAPAGAPSSAPAPLPVPDLPPVPASPSRGESGAGALAARSIPLDDGGWAARLAFAPLVLERRAVGVTVTAAAVSLTRRTDGTALAHLRLPTWNCLTSEAPADPQAAGCAPGPVEYADLPSPALGTTTEDGGLRLTGRFPTYTRPTGSAPVYTGRVYELTVTLAADDPATDDGAEPGGGPSWVPARGTLFLGTDRVESLADPTLSAARAGD